MQKYKIKSLDEVTYIPDTTIKDIKRGLHIITATAIALAILGIVLCVKHIKLGVEYEALNKEKQTLEGITEMQSSMIRDLEENCKDLYREIENLKFGGNQWKIN